MMALRRPPSQQLVQRSVEEIGLRTIADVVVSLRKCGVQALNEEFRASDEGDETSDVMRDAQGVLPWRRLVLREFRSVEAFEEY